MRHFRIGIKITFIIYFLFGISAVAIGQSDDVYTNPVKDSNHPDPGALVLEDDNLEGFVVVSTSNYASNGDGPAFPILYSTDLVQWEEKGHVFAQNDWPSWAYTDMWAPEIHYVNSNYYVYFSARQTSNNKLSIGVAMSLNHSNPFGPYQDLGRPLIEDERGVIDIHWFRDPNTNIPYLVWKTDDNAIGLPSSIFIRQVEEDGITFQDNWPTVEIMRADRPEDTNVVEGPSIIYRDPFYYLFFSGNVFTSSNYHVTVARSSTVDGTYNRYEGEPFLHIDFDRYDNGENCTFVGAGHGTPLYLASSDEWWYVYHSWKYDMINVYPPGRVLNIDKMEWGSDDWPSVGIPSDTPVSKPNVN